VRKKWAQKEKFEDGVIYQTLFSERENIRSQKFLLKMKVSCFNVQKMDYLQQNDVKRIGIIGKNLGRAFVVDVVRYRLQNVGGQVQNLKRGIQ